MRKLARTATAAAFLASLLAAIGAEAAEGPPLAGCYERVYDAAHLRQHPGQLVVRVTLAVAADSANDADKTNPIVASGALKLWVRGKPQSFDSLGACSAQGTGLLCNGSSSAAEADPCKGAQDGVRQCRIDGGDSGTFKIEPRPGGVLVSIRDRLELVPAPYDSGPFLYLSPKKPRKPHLPADETIARSLQIEPRTDCRMG